MKRFSSSITATDCITICFCVFLTLLNLFFYPSIPNALLYIVCNVIIIGGIVFIGEQAFKKRNILFQLVHGWYPLILIFLLFKETYGMIHPLWRYDFDQLLISCDRFIFGTDPTVFLQKISIPLLTEILQLAYTSYYILFVLLAVELYLKKDKAPFHYAVMCVVYGFFLSYAGYFLLPAVGPRFTLHDFTHIDSELPGLYFTPILRGIINAGESISATLTNPINIVQRDVFPSGHTELTLIVMYLALKFRIHSRWFIVIAGTLLVFSTVYLRYHYVVDVLGGIVFMLFTLWTAAFIDNYFQARKSSLRNTAKTIPEH